MSLQSSRSPRRPALWAGIAVAAGVWLAGWSAEHLIWTLAALCLLLLLPGEWHKPWRSVWIYLLLMTVGGAHLLLLRHARPEQDLKYHPDSNGPVLVYGRVSSEPDLRPHLTLVYLDADSVQYGDKVRSRRGGVLLRLSSDVSVAYGEYLVVRGRLRSIARARNPGEFDYATYLARRDVHTELTGRNGPEVIGRGSERDFGWTANVVAPLRAWILDRITRHIHGDPAALVMGLMFGERKRLQYGTLEQFQNTGTLHLLAVSGSNVAVVIGVVWSMLALLHAPRPARTVITLLALVLFCALSRNQPSVLRASVAGALVLLGHTWHRRIDPLNIWGGSLLLILLAAPRQLFDVGFQLSFAAALGIIVFAPILSRWPSGRRWHRRFGRVIVSAVGVSVVAQLAVTPILADSFNRVPSITPLSNLICVPTAGLATASGLVTLIVAPIGGPVLSLFAGATWFFAEVLLAAVNFFDRLGLPVIEFVSPSAVSVVLYYVTICLLAAMILRPRWWRRVVFALIVVAHTALWPRVLANSPTLEIIVLDCGSAAVSLARWPDGEVWLIEQKVTRRSGHFARVVEPFLRRHGWAPPRQIWLLDGKRNTARFRGQWPSGKIIADSDDLKFAAHGGSDRDAVPYHVTSRLSSAGRRIAAIQIRGAGGTILWLAPETGLSILEAATEEGRFCLVIPGPIPVPPPNWGSGVTLTVIEAAPSFRDSGAEELLSNPGKLSTVSSGGIQISGLGDSLRTASAIR